MNLLLDTQIFLWSLADSKKLTPKARTLILEADQVYVSAASIWEVAIKSSSGKLELDPELVRAEIQSSGFLELPVLARHAARVASLPYYHRDPFDRLLVAQAILEPLGLLTADKLLPPYSSLVQLV